MKTDTIAETIKTLRRRCKNTNIVRAKEQLDYSQFHPTEVFSIEKFFADLGAPNAQFYLGQCYDYGWGGQKKNQKKAIFWYRKAVKNSKHPNAAYNLADILNHLKGKKYQEERTKLLNIASKSLHTDAMVTLGAIYFNNYIETGHTPFKRQFLKLYEDAATLRNSSAQYNLYLAYKNGDGVTTNPSIAFRYLKMAAKNGHRKAKRILSSKNK
jgi:uncharacterized protein